MVKFCRGICVILKMVYEKCVLPLFPAPPPSKREDKTPPKTWPATEPQLYLLVSFISIYIKIIQGGNANLLKLVCSYLRDSFPEVFVRSVY